MVLTRGGSSSFIPTANANSGANNNTNEAPIPEVNVDPNPQGMPPPPPPPQFSLAQMMAMQTQILQGMAATMANLAQPAQAPVQQQPVNPHRDRLGDFLRTKSPTFGSAKNPLEADDWLKTVNKKLMIAQCTDHEKVLFATHQLSGAANDWWEAYYAAHEDADNISWAEFRGAFRAHFIPQGTMKLKKKEFLDLKQGSMSCLAMPLKLLKLTPPSKNTSWKDWKIICSASSYLLSSPVSRGWWIRPLLWKANAAKSVKSARWHLRTSMVEATCDLVSCSSQHLNIGRQYRDAPSFQHRVLDFRFSALSTRRLAPMQLCLLSRMLLKEMKWTVHASAVVQQDTLQETVLERLLFRHLLRMAPIPSHLLQHFVASRTTLEDVSIM